MVLVLFPLSAGFPLLVAASDLSAPKKCRARFGLDQQNNWCGPCRCVWCVLAQARARWRLANCTLRLPPLLSAAAFSFLFPLPRVCSARLSWTLSFLQPCPAGLSLGSHSVVFIFLTSFWETRVLPVYARVFVWMVSVCLIFGRSYRGFITGYQKSKTGRFGLGGSDGLVVMMENIPVLPAWT